MSPDRIKKLLDRTPFEPFTVVTGDGGAINVLSKEFTLLYPGGRTLRIVSPKFKGAADEADFEEQVIDVFLITRVTTPPIKGPGNGAGRRRAG